MAMTDLSLEFAAKQFSGLSSVTSLYIATGSGSTAEADADVALAVENTLNGSARALATASYVETGDIAKLSISFTFTGAVTVREFGLFSASTGDTCLYRHVLDADRSYISAQGIDIEIPIPFGRGV
jgi:hypothetical protein